MQRLRAPCTEGYEECGDIEEVEGAVVGEVGDGVVGCECGEECGDIEEVEGAVAGEIGGAIGSGEGEAVARPGACANLTVSVRTDHNNPIEYADR